MTRYARVTVRSYKDSDMAGLPRDNRERGKWFVHGIKGMGADLLGTYEKKSKAVKEARDAAKSDRDGETILLVKNLEGDDVTERKVYAQETTTFTP